MKKIVVFFFIFFISFASVAGTSEFDKLFPVLTKAPKGKEVEPKTTEELEKLFENSDTELPRIFVKKLPSDFSEKGNKKLYSKVLTALILRENEQILGERILFLLLKEKADKGESWTPKEKDFFNYLVNKYDAIVLKTIPTQLADLIVKIDEIPPALALAQSALDTDFGKKNMDSPFGQTGWLDNKTYAPIKYKNLTDAVKAYVIEMNSIPNYDAWRLAREKQGYLKNLRSSYYMIQGLRPYRPEDVAYVEKIRKLMNKNTFLFDMDKLNLKKD